MAYTDSVRDKPAVVKPSPNGPIRVDAHWVWSPRKNHAERKTFLHDRVVFQGAQRRITRKI
jgi:hypothetical protein